MVIIVEDQKVNNHFLQVDMYNVVIVVVENKFQFNSYVPEDTT